MFAMSNILAFWMTTGGLGVLGLLIQRTHKTSMREHASGRTLWERVERKVDAVSTETWANGHKIDDVHAVIKRHVTDTNPHRQGERNETD